MERKEKEKPAFYDELFGSHIEQDKILESAPAIEKWERNELKSSLSTIPLRNLQLNTKDSIDNNKRWMKSISKKITTVDDIITIVASTGFCLGGQTLSKAKFEKQYKLYFNEFKKLFLYFFYF